MENQAPIAVFIYNRPDHLRQTLTSLVSCDGFAESPIVVFGDGPKENESLSQIEKARNVAREMLGDRADYIFSDKNKGLAHSIIEGISSLTVKFGRVIVIEDDLILTPNFLLFMNSALVFYESDEKVFQVSGHMFNIPSLLNSKEALLLPWTTTWGWATWDKKWSYFDPDAKGWESLLSDQQLRDRFNLNGAYDYTTMLQRQMKGNLDSWGIRWYWSVFKNNGLTVFPPSTLIENKGMDGFGSHGRGIFRNFSSDKIKTTTLSYSYDFPSSISNKNTIDLICQKIKSLNGGKIGKVVDIFKSIYSKVHILLYRH
jgi:hypothetical protein